MSDRILADHPHTGPGDGRTECEVCGKYVWPAIHSCKRVPATDRARARSAATGQLSFDDHDDAEVIARRLNQKLPPLPKVR